MVMKLALSGIVIILLTACGGGGGSASPNGQQAGYDPALKEQTITAQQLQSVKEIAAENTVTVQSDVALLGSSPDLVVKGNLVIH